MVGELHHSDGPCANGGAASVAAEGDVSGTGATHAVSEERKCGKTPFAALAAQQDAARRSGSGVPLLRVSSTPLRDPHR